ncbi:MAG TPA: ribosome small subunit-dependent GTPase A [Pirellulales bacterium]|nr:ribosome small subunit-dependent GTPase A [Pirellulales bacterium]
MAKKKKIRTEFRKNRVTRARSSDWTKRFHTDDVREDQAVRGERISGRGELTRKRTILVDDLATEQAEGETVLGVDATTCLAGRVLSVQGLVSTVQAGDGQLYQCATRRLLKTLSTDQRHVVAAGDRVLFRPSPGNEGIIERVDPRYGVLSRATRGRQHVLVANVDQLLIVGSAAEPYLKPNLIDRFLVSAAKNKIRPLIVINKVDLVDRATLMPIVGVYSQMGYRTLFVSARTGFGVDRLRRALAGCATAVAGQSGVGKSSLLNAVEPGFGLRVAEVSEETQKGRHTTTTARLLPLAAGGYVIDTPGIRQFQLWDVIREEVAGYYRDIRPFVSKCRFPDCTHTHEADCAVKDAVADGWLDARRYESYCHLFAGDMDS